MTITDFYAFAIRFVATARGGASTTWGRAREKRDGEETCERRAEADQRRTEKGQRSGEVGEGGRKKTEGRTTASGKSSVKTCCGLFYLLHIRRTRKPVVVATGRRRAGTGAWESSKDWRGSEATERRATAFESEWRWDFYNTDGLDLCHCFDEPCRDSGLSGVVLKLNHFEIGLDHVCKANNSKTVVKKNKSK